MEAWLTSEWQRTSAWQILLRPVSWLFRLLVAIRRRGYRAGLLESHPAGIPVIVVGNITVGGTGKTPLVLALAEALKARGLQCGIVTRGYRRGSGEGGSKAIQILPDTKTGASLSDEASLLANRSDVPVFVCDDRFKAVEQLLLIYPEVKAIISDDGLQHYALQRDFEICVIDGARGLGNGALLPAGPLREPPSRLKSVDAIVINGDSGKSTVPFSNEVPTFHMVLANEILINVKTERWLSVDAALTEFEGSRIHAIAGTGHPQRFFSHVGALGFVLAGSKAFPDHHNFSASDMPGPEAAIILMTEKDAVKCGTFADERMWFMRVDAVLPEQFFEFVMKKLFH
ncbi:MAG: tetraacyldisaccharide 4'-kinase [Betaproteobacteria bacterium]